MIAGTPPGVRILSMTINEPLLPASLVKIPLLILTLLSSASAQDGVLPVKSETPAAYPPGTKGVVVTVDAAFTTKHENTAPPVPFQITAPKANNIRVMAGGKKTGVPELLRLTLPAADGKKAAEILRFGPLQLLAGPVEQRIKAAAELLKTKAFTMFTRGFENPEALETYQTKIGGNDAVCLHIKMNEPGGKPVWLVKATAILNPGRPLPTPVFTILVM